jgi:hypothetical protein
MATTAELQQLVGKLMLDPAFRRDFAADPAAGAATLNIQLTDEETESFRQNLAGFVAAASELEKNAAQRPEIMAAGHVAAIFRE